MRRVDWELLLVGTPSLVQVTEVGGEEVERTANEKLGGLWERLVSSWKVTGNTTTGPPMGGGGRRGGEGRGRGRRGEGGGGGEEGEREEEEGGRG